MIQGAGRVTMTCSLLFLFVFVFFFCFVFLEDSPGGAQEVSNKPLSSSGSTSASKRGGNCRERLSKSHTKPFCYRCITKLAGKEASGLIKDFLKSVLKEMLATIQSFRTSTHTPLVVGSEEPTPKEGPSSQESLLSKPGPSISLPFSQGLPRLSSGKRMRWRKQRAR